MYFQKPGKIAYNTMFNNLSFFTINIRVTLTGFYFRSFLMMFLEVLL